MTFITGLVTFLETNIPEVGSRVYPQVLPQNPVLPALTYHQVSGPAERSHSGNSNLTKARYQISCWSKNYLEVKSIAVTITQALNGYKGGAGTKTIQASFKANEIDDYEPDTGLRRAIVDVIITHRIVE